MILDPHMAFDFLGAVKTCKNFGPSELWGMRSSRFMHYASFLRIRVFLCESSMVFSISVGPFEGQATATPRDTEFIHLPMAPPD